MTVEQLLDLVRRRIGVIGRQERGYREEGKDVDRSPAEDAETAEGTFAANPEAEAREGEIVAYRQWILRPCDKYSFPHLHSTVVEFCWDGPVAHMVEPSGLVKQEGQSHPVVAVGGPGPGIYALKVSDPPMDYLEPGDLFTIGNPPVYTDQPAAHGEVALWGTVIEHEHGYRAEHAVVNKIVFCSKQFDDAEGLAEKLRALYDCEVDVR